MFFTVIKAELGIKQVGTLSLDELKKALVNGLKRSGWSADQADLIPRVKQATSLSEIRDIFSPEVCSVPKWYHFTSVKKGVVKKGVS